MLNKVNYKLINLTLVVLVIFFLYRTGYLWMGITNKIVNIILPFLFAFALAYALYPTLQWMQKKKIPKGIGVAIIVVVLLAIISGLIYVVSTVLVGQMSSLFTNILDFIKKLSEMDFGSEFNFSGLETNLNDIFKNIMGNVGNYVSNGTIHFVNSSLTLLSKICIGAAAFVYILIDMDKIRLEVRNFFSKRKKKTFDFVASLDKQMKKYLSGLVTVMIISVFEYGIVYSLIGHPDALLLGLLAGFANLIPYFGGIMNNCVAAITAFVISPSLFIKTLIVFTVLSMVDSYVINANVYGKTNSIHPLMVIFSVFAGSAVFGIMGIVISFPLAILMVTTYKFYKDDIFQNIRGGTKKIIEK